MRGALGGPRVLLRRLREVMAEPVSAQDRLDKVVVLIAANMVAEVCSVYVLRVDGTLELYATEGLKREAVHQTVLRADEGLVGLVASEANPINLSDAQAHPAFSYRPETGEENYHSFLGVPVLRAGNTLGVLVVQNRARRTYTEEEEEALQTTAMVLAEMIASGDLSALAGPGAEPVARHAMFSRSLSGLTPLSPPYARISTGWLSIAMSPRPASIAMFSKPIACFPTTRAGCTKCERR
jgi:phosphotransferase system, enzyme I, PtsP